MKPHSSRVAATLGAALLVAMPAFAAPFSSGSSGADGALAPAADVSITLPANGVLNYTTVNIPSGVTVRFTKNAANTPVVMLATGTVKIAGSIDVGGANSPTTKVGAIANGLAGAGGPGGFDGGRGGVAEPGTRGGNGYGPGGGGGGTSVAGVCAGYAQGGGGGGFAAAGEGSNCVRQNYAGSTGVGGGAYGSLGMLPLTGGSGGGGGSGSRVAGNLPGSGGGGGGGAIMIVASGSVEVSGSIKASGGTAGNINNGDCAASNESSGGGGGGGAGGAVRIIAPSVSGAGNINVAGGAGGCRTGASNAGNQINSGGYGAVGRIHVEEVQQGSFSVSLIPGLTITSVAGIALAANAGEVSLPLDQGNPVTIGISASGVPVGSAVTLSLFQPYAATVTATASALAGTLQASTSTGSINIPSGSSVLMASTTYTLSVALGEALSIYAEGERVDKVSLAAALGGETRVTLITVSGREFVVPAAVLATLPG